MKNKIAIVLCGTRPHIELIKRLKEIEYYIILVDYAENPIAKEYADLHLVENAFDKFKVLEIAIEYNVDLVISVAADQAYVVSAYVMEKIGKYHPLSYETAKIIADKSTMKKKMNNNSISTSNYIETSDLSNFNQSDLCYPLVVKPVDNYGSKGVRVCANYDELVLNFSLALDASKKRQVIIEEFKKGREMNVYCYLKNNHLEIMLISEKIALSNQNEAVMQSAGIISEADISSEQRNAIFIEVLKIKEVFNLNNTMILVQLILDESNKVSILEFAPRLGGGLSYRLLKILTKQNPINLSIDLFIKGNSSFIFKESTIKICILHIFSKKGRFNEIINYKPLIQENIISEIFIDKGRDGIIDGSMSSSDRVAQIIINGSTYAELKTKSQITIDSLDITNMYGNKNKMVKNIYHQMFTK